MIDGRFFALGRIAAFQHFVDLSGELADIVQFGMVVDLLGLGIRPAEDGFADFLVDAIFRKDGIQGVTQGMDPCMGYV